MVKILYKVLFSWGIIVFNLLSLISLYIWGKDYFNSQTYWILFAIFIVALLFSAGRIIYYVIQKKNQRIKDLEKEIDKKNELKLELRFKEIDPIKIINTGNCVNGFVLKEFGIQLNLKVINVSNFSVTLYPIVAKITNGTLPWKEKGGRSVLLDGEKFVKPKKLEPDDEFDIQYIFKFAVEENRNQRELWKNFLNDLKKTGDLEFEVSYEIRTGEKRKREFLKSKKINFKELYFETVMKGTRKQCNIQDQEIIDLVKDIYPNKNW